MVEFFNGTNASPSSSSARLSQESFARPDPCPFCQLPARDEYSLLLHIESEHAEDNPFPGAPSAYAEYYFDNASVDDERLINSCIGDSDSSYILCPEDGCEEYISLLDLQTHMDFHDAENLAMEQTQAVAKERAGRSGREHRHHHHHHRRREEGAGEAERSEKRREKADSGKHHRSSSSAGHHHHHHHHHHREHRGGDHAARRHDKDNEKDEKVAFVSAPSRSRSSVRGLSWFERFALAITQPVPDQSRKSRSGSVGPRRSESRSRKRSRSRSRDAAAHSARRSDSRRADAVLVRRSDGKRVELRKGEPRKQVAAPAERSYSKGRHSSRSSSKSGIKKLGKSDLGPYAHEDQMPDWLRAELEKGGKTVTVRKQDPATGRLMNVVQIANETPNLIPTIALLSERDPEIVRTYLCHPGTKHIGKQIPKEGGFCGYRNIQMMISYIQAAFPRGSHPFEGRIPTILKMQDLIEEGWAKGINSTAKMETGGIKGTRKYIGTSEAQTLLTSVGLRSRARAFTKSSDSSGGLETQKALLAFVEDYFSAETPADSASSVKIVCTSKPPIYLQHSGHSITIVGMEKWRDGSSSLLVFDPFFSPTEAMKNLAGARKLGSRLRPEVLLKVYRRKINYLAKYKEFEIILLDP